MKTFSKSTFAIVAALGLAGCEMGMNAGLNVEAGLSYDDFQRQYGVDQATVVAIDADNDGIITENEWQAAGY